MFNFSSTVASFEHQLQGREVELVKGKEFWVSSKIQQKLYLDLTFLGLAVNKEYDSY